MKLNDLKIGDSASILSVDASDNIKRRLMDLGFNRGVVITPVLENTSMRAYKVKGTVVCVRKKDTMKIEVSK